MYGKAPQAVTIEDHRSLNSHDWHLFGETPTISVYGDELYDIDLRFCVGLTYTYKHIQALKQAYENDYQQRYS